MRAPLDMLHPAGPFAQQISPLLWGLIWLSIIVVLLVAAAVGAGIFLGMQTPRDPSHIAPEDAPRAVRWIYGATALSTVLLVVFVGWTFTTMAGISTHQDAALTVDVAGAQWWWRFAYEGQGANPAFVTANEIHIPVGVPVRFRITSLDVIHSFWIPALGGKTDAIPEQSNEAWLQADRAGTYRGQCAEYCGQQHAGMGLTVIAQPQAEFDAWRAHEAADAEPSGSKGETEFVLSCGRCHAVRGTGAKGDLAPDLTHLMARTTLASGVLDNTHGNLAGWIANPQGLKPGTKMPTIPLSGPDLEAILTYLETLS